MIFNLSCLLFFTVILIYSLSKKTSKNYFLENIFSYPKNYYICVICILIIGIFIRVYNFGVVPIGVNQDEAMAAVDAFALSKYGADRFLMPFPAHFTAWGYGQMSVLLSYLMVPFIKIFGFNMVSIRLPMLIISIASIWIFFSFMKDVFGKKPAIIGLFLLAINPWQIMQSRWSLDCNLFPHFILLSIYFFYLGLKKTIFLAISMIFFGLSMYTYGIAFYSVPLMLIILSIYLFKNKIVKLRDYMFCLAAYLIVALPILLVIIVNALKLKTFTYILFTIPFFEDSIRINDLLPFSSNILLQFLKNATSLINITLIQTKDAPWNSITNFGPLYLFALPLILAGGIYLFSIYQKNDESKPGIFILFAWLMVAVFSGIFVNNVNINRINIIFYPLIILCSLGIYYLFFQKNSNKILSAISIIIFTTSFVCFSYEYFGAQSKLISYYFYNGLGKSIEYAENANSDTFYITKNTQQTGSQNVSEILTLFYAKTDAKYFNNKKDIYKDNGIKLLPYSSRYQYISPESYDFTLAAPGIYIVRNEEVEYLNNAGFTFKSFDDFTVAEKH